MNSNERKLFNKLTEHNISITILWSLGGDIKDIGIDTTKHDAKVRADAIDEFVSMLTNKEIAQTYDFDDVLCSGNYDANFNDFRNYVRAIAEQLKEKKNEV